MEEIIASFVQTSKKINAMVRMKAAYARDAQEAWANVYVLGIVQRQNQY